MYPMIIPKLLTTASLTMSALSSVSICCNMDNTKELRISFCRDRKDDYKLYIYIAQLSLDCVKYLVLNGKNLSNGYQL